MILFALIGATLFWNPNPDSDGVQAYKLYQATSVIGPWTHVASTANTSLVVNLAPGQYFFFVTASNFWGESGPSNITNTPTVASNITTLRIQR